MKELTLKPNCDPEEPGVVRNRLKKSFPRKIFCKMSSALIKGNDLFVDELYEEALKSYNESIAQQSNNNSAFLKRSACYFKLEKYSESLSDAETVLKTEPTNKIGLNRKGAAAFALGNYNQAKQAFEALYEQDKSPESKIWIRKCKAELEDSGLSFPSQAAPANEKTQQQPLEKAQAQTPTPALQTTPAQAAPTQPEEQVNRPRHDWYQSQTNVYINIFVKKVRPEQAKVDIQDKRISLVINTDQEYVFDAHLSGTIIPSETKVDYLTTKIEVSLKKATGLQWPALEEKKIITQKKENKNWDKIINEAGPLDMEGDELNKVFKDIYGNGSDEQRKAMIKSFVNILFF